MGRVKEGAVLSSSSYWEFHLLVCSMLTAMYLSLERESERERCEGSIRVSVGDRVIIYRIRRQFN